MISNNNTQVLPVESKKCIKCKNHLPLCSFHKNRTYKDGHAYTCRKCMLQYLKVYNHTPKRIEQKRTYDKIFTQKEDNKLKSRERSRVYLKQKYNTNLEYKLKHKMRTRLNAALRNVSMMKSSPTMELVGCTAHELKLYLESKFINGMNWENYTRNGWHVDHIQPCNSFDLIDPDQQKKCFHYTNLQPMWCEDNWSKGSKLV